MLKTTMVNIWENTCAKHFIVLFKSSFYCLPLLWILIGKLEEGEIDTFAKQGRKSQKDKASNVEERRATGELSEGTSKGETSGHLPAENVELGQSCTAMEAH